MVLGAGFRGGKQEAENAAQRAAGVTTGWTRPGKKESDRLPGRPQSSRLKRQGKHLGGDLNIQCGETQ